MKDPYSVQSRLGQCLYDHSNKCPKQQKISIQFHSRSHQAHSIKQFAPTLFQQVKQPETFKHNPGNGRIQEPFRAA